MEVEDLSYWLTSISTEAGEELPKGIKDVSEMFDNKAKNKKKKVKQIAEAGAAFVLGMLLHFLINSIL